MKEEIIINTQFALFFDQPLSKPEEFWQPFNSEMGGIFDQTPIILPVPNESKLYDVPVVQMTSIKGVYSCNIARSRVDLFIAGVGRQKFSDIKNNLLEKIEKYYSFFSTKSEIKRVGFVNRFFIRDEGQDKTIAKLLNSDFKTLHEGDAHQAYVRYVSRIRTRSFDVNNFTAIERFFARISGVGEGIKGVLITRDFNTIPEKNYKSQFSWNNIKEFIEDSERKFKLENIKNILWPRT